MKIDQVLDEYRQGDPDKRLSLFLYHRELRDEFSCIEEDDRPALSEVRQTSEPLRQSMIQKGPLPVSEPVLPPEVPDVYGSDSTLKTVDKALCLCYHRWQSDHPA